MECIPTTNLSQLPSKDISVLFAELMTGNFCLSISSLRIWNVVKCPGIPGTEFEAELFLRCSVSCSWLRGKIKAYRVVAKKDRPNTSTTTERHFYLVEVHLQPSYSCLRSWLETSSYTNSFSSALLIAGKTWGWDTILDKNYGINTLEVSFTKNMKLKNV